MHNKFGKSFLVMKLVVVFFCFFLMQSGFTAVYAAKHHKKNVATKKVSAKSRGAKKSVASGQEEELAIDSMPSAALGATPMLPDFAVKSYILLDANSGYVIAQKNANDRVPPASLTKVMSLYLAANALRSGKIHLNDQVTVSEKAWRTGGSRMFIKVGSSVSVEDLIKGIVIASGNDATVALAEHIAGSEENFVSLMNRTAQSLKMNNTGFVESSGLLDDQNYSSAADLATLSRVWILNFPDYYPWFKEKWINYNGIKQPNRNRLLWRDSTVDGIKTGHTEKAGYCLIASAVRNDMRLISIVMGAKNDAVRAKYSLSLLNYGFRFFETRKLFAANTALVAPTILFGKHRKTALGLARDLYITLPAGQQQKLRAQAVINERLKAPIVGGQVCGVLHLLLDNKVIMTKNLVALQDNPRTNIIFALFDYIKILFQR